MSITDATDAALAAEAREGPPIERGSPQSGDTLERAPGLDGLNYDPEREIPHANPQALDDALRHAEDELAKAWNATENDTAREALAGATLAVTHLREVHFPRWNEGGTR